MDDYQTFRHNCLYASAVPPLEVPTEKEWKDMGEPSTFEEYLDEKGRLRVAWQAIGSDEIHEIVG